MSFSFIKMFFFLSLAIVFLFILLLCYYLKNKREVVERRVSSQTDVLGKLIREFKLQACFGYGSGGGNGGGGNELFHAQPSSRLEPLLEQDDESDSDSSSFNEDGADTDEESDDDNSVGMEKVQDDDLLDINTTVKNTDKDATPDEYKDLDFEKVANQETPVVEECDETVRVSAEETEDEDDDLPALISEPVEEDDDDDEDETKAEPKEPVFDNEESVQEKNAIHEDYKKMSLVQLKHVAQHTFNLSTTKIAKMKKDELLKLVLAE